MSFVKGEVELQGRKGKDGGKRDSERERVCEKGLFDTEGTNLHILPRTEQAGTACVHLAIYRVELDRIGSDRRNLPIS